MTPKTQYQKMRENRERREYEFWAGKFDNSVAQSGPFGHVHVAPKDADPHAELRKTWAPGQQWQTRRIGSENWEILNFDPAWNQFWEYRQAPQEKPWYPDHGNWVEVPDECMEMPKAIKPETIIQVLFLEERNSQSYRAYKAEGVYWDWDEDPEDESRIVAYKVVAP